MIKILVWSAVVAALLLQWEPIARRASRTVREFSSVSWSGESLQDLAK